MEISYDDRPISMYDNLNVTTTAMNANATSSAPKTKQPTMATTTSTTSSPPSSSTAKTNGAIHSSTPFADITFKFNDNNNTKQQQPQQQYQQQPQQLQINGNRNLNHIPAPNTSDLYAMPFKMANTPPMLTKPSTITTTATSPLMPPAATATAAATAASLGNALTSSSSSPQPLAKPTVTTARPTERPLSQHSQSELNETTSHSIAAVKAALNEAKSKFFGLNGYTPHQHQQHQPEPEPLYDLNESQLQHLLPTTTDQSPTIQQLQPQQVQKPQPKYQNIPENSAIFRNQAPELPPKPLEYQNLNKQPSPPQPPKQSQQQQPVTKAAATPNNNTTMPATISPMEHQSQPHRKMSPGATYNQISLNDIDGPPRSQSVYMATTVPQNIKGNKIAGRHTPTRSSLRHSRMLVVTNKHYEEIQHPNPMGFRQPNLARWLLILQIIIGILLISLSIWIFMLAPNTPIQDNPYWCGLVLLLTGIIGLVLIRYHRIKRDKTREHCFIFLRMDSYVLSLLSLVLCCVALIFAAIHYCRITAQDTKCESGNMFIEHASCVCTFNTPTMSSTNTTMASLAGPSLVDDGRETEEAIDFSYKFEYRDLSCLEVMGPWATILGLSFILNSLGLLISLAYMVLLACCRSTSKRSYTTVRTSTF